MFIEELQKDILRCKNVVSEISIKHYSQNSYTEIVDKIFQDIFEEYFKNPCPDKLEPHGGHISEEGLKKIRKTQGI